jgi:hypothetical protein
MTNIANYSVSLIIYKKHFFLETSQKLKTKTVNLKEGIITFNKQELCL